MPDTPTITEPLHYVTQRGQPYGSRSRCCDMCGRMCWPGMDGSAQFWTDDLQEYTDHALNCSRVQS